MLQSMIKEPFPTRAEVSDIANAVYDYTDCVMLSGETANGEYPLKAVEMMEKTVTFYETKTENNLANLPKKIVDETSALICDAAYDLYLDYIQGEKDISGFIVFSQTGKTASIISSYRPKVPIFAFVPDKKICDYLTACFGVESFPFKFKGSDQVTLHELNEGVQILENLKFLNQSRGKLIVIHGDKWGQGTGATTIRIV
jgi:pyruvate kinase